MIFSDKEMKKGKRRTDRLGYIIIDADGAIHKGRGVFTYKSTYDVVADICWRLFLDTDSILSYRLQVIL